MTHARSIAQILLESKAVSLNPSQPFQYSSGLTSPIYCDNRVLISYPLYRKIIVKGLAECIHQQALTCHVIAGTATAGIPWAAWLAEILNKPLVYVRSKAKQHGTGKQIEGHLKRGQQAIIIEDLISTGGSVINCAQALRQAGATVTDCLAIFNYELPQSQHALAQAELTCHNLCEITSLLATAVELNAITVQEQEIVMQWQQQPEVWSHDDA